MKLANLLLHVFVGILFVLYAITPFVISGILQIVYGGMPIDTLPRMYTNVLTAMFAFFAAGGCILLACLAFWAFKEKPAGYLVLEIVNSVLGIFLALGILIARLVSFFRSTVGLIQFRFIFIPVFFILLFNTITLIMAVFIHIREKKKAENDLLLENEIYQDEYSR